MAIAFVFVVVSLSIMAIIEAFKLLKSNERAAKVVKFDSLNVFSPHLVVCRIYSTYTLQSKVELESDQ